MLIQWGYQTGLPSSKPRTRHIGVFPWQWKSSILFWQIFSTKYLIAYPQQNIKLGGLESTGHAFSDNNDTIIQIQITWLWVIQIPSVLTVFELFWTFSNIFLNEYYVFPKLMLLLHEDSFPRADPVVFYTLLGFTPEVRISVFKKKKKAFFKLSIVVQFANQPVWSRSCISKTCSLVFLCY